MRILEFLPLHYLEGRVCGVCTGDRKANTMDLSEFNVNVMTRNKGEHQCSPYDPGIQK